MKGSDNAWMKDRRSGALPDKRRKENHMGNSEIKTNLLRADPDYGKRMGSYTLRDTLTALGYYLLMMAAYYFMGRHMATTGQYYVVPVNFIGMILIPLLICRRPSALGICRKNLKKSLTVSGILGGLILLSIAIVPGMISGARLLPFPKLAYNLVYYLIVIGLSEEIAFRGFIQPRLFPALKKEWLAVLAGGILFVLSHYPFQMAMRNMSFTEYLPTFLENAPFQFLWHLVFTALYRRYDNIWGSALLHGMIDMSMGLFA